MFLQFIQEQSITIANSYKMVFYCNVYFITYREGGVMVDRGYFGQRGVILDKYGKIINNVA